mmetsp:Transcript_12703/g.38302  ORF Transcript_12703/g.38302 Transcript_12703/m.38302 type:complete len:309 (+) Transcript_12703:1219-2145(+)
MSAPFFLAVVVFRLEEAVAEELVEGNAAVDAGLFDGRVGLDAAGDAAATGERDALFFEGRALDALVDVGLLQILVGRGAGDEVDEAGLVEAAARDLLVVEVERRRRVGGLVGKERRRDRRFRLEDLVVSVDDFARDGVDFEHAFELGLLGVLPRLPRELVFCLLLLLQRCLLRRRRVVVGFFREGVGAADRYVVRAGAQTSQITGLVDHEPVLKIIRRQERHVRRRRHVLDAMKILDGRVDRVRIPKETVLTRGVALAALRVFVFKGRDLEVDADRRIVDGQGARGLRLVALDHQQLEPQRHPDRHVQ